MRPIGYFVHHQGRGHAERAAAIAHSMDPRRPLCIFTARPEALPPLPSHVEVTRLPSLFERDPELPIRPALDGAQTPQTLHCAPLGWPAIRRAMGTLASWFDRADPALMVSDVSAEIAQLSRIAGVPVVKVLQHGDRSDPGHMAAYAGAAGLLAPWHEDLEQPNRPKWMRAKTCYAPGIGLSGRKRPAAFARAALGIAPERRLVVVISGGGGGGLPLAPLTLGARSMPDTDWVVLGQVSAEWHETRPGNLREMGWVSTVGDWLDAADVVVASAGNTLCHEILARGLPWIVVPEWRYFDEQLDKARALARANCAHCCEGWPGSTESWQRAIAAAASIDAERARSLAPADGAQLAATWLDRLAHDLWVETPSAAQLAAE